MSPGFSCCCVSFPAEAIRYLYPQTSGILDWYEIGIISAATAYATATAHGRRHRDHNDHNVLVKV